MFLVVTNDTNDTSVLCVVKTSTIVYNDTISLYMYAYPINSMTKQMVKGLSLLKEYMINRKKANTMSKYISLDVDIPYQNRVMEKM